MSWDFLLAATQVILDLCLLPTLLKASSYVPRLTSLITAGGLAFISFSLIHLNAPLGAAGAGLGASLWAVIFILRGTDKK